MGLRSSLFLWVLFVAAWSVADVASAETIIKRKDAAQRGQGDKPVIVVDSNTVLAGLRDSNSRFTLLHYDVDDDGMLVSGHKATGPHTVGHDLTQTLWGTVVSATLVPADNQSVGALTLTSYAIDDAAIVKLGEVRALPSDGDDSKGGPTFAPQPAKPSTPGRLKARPSRDTKPKRDLARKTKPSADPVTGVAGAKLAPQTRPGLFASEVALEDITLSAGDTGLKKERVVTAIINAEGKLQLDTWAIGDNKRIAHLHRNTNAGATKKVSLVKWNQGVITALIDSQDKVRVIAWRVDGNGKLFRKGTAHYVEATEIDAARFSAEEGEDRYLVAVRTKQGDVRTLLADIDGTGTKQKIIAEGTGPKASHVRITQSAAFEQDELRPDTFYVATRDSDNKLNIAKWRVSGNQLVLGANKSFHSITDVAIGLEPYMSGFDDGVDGMVTLSRTNGALRLDLWSSYFREIAAGGGNVKAPEPPNYSLVFSENDPANELAEFTYPADMPNVRWPTGYNGCSYLDRKKVNRAWARAHYNMWRANQVMAWLKDNPDHRKRAWAYGYDSDYGSVDEGFTNHVPRAWFGPYNSSRFHKVQRSINKVWRERFRDRQFTVECRRKHAGASGAHICFTGKSSANHVVLGKVNFCSQWLDQNGSVESDARLVVHEVFHWLKIPKSGWWVTDNHDYWTKCGLAGYRALQRMQHDKAAYISNNRGCKERNYNRSVRNNDNYAYFTSILGARIYSGAGADDTVDQFPHKSFWE